jgi:hypothetical protein
MTARSTSPLGPGYSFIWEITAGHCAGVALERRDGLFVACGEDFGGLELILIDVAEGKLERLDGDGNLRRASVRGGSDPDSAEWFADDPYLHRIRIVPFGEALHAVLATPRARKIVLPGGVGTAWGSRAGRASTGS